MRSRRGHPERARGARRRRLALAGSLACLAVLAQASPAMAVPTNLSPPGAPQLSGRTLTTDSGSWLLATNFTYAWYRCDGAGAGCTQVPGRAGTGYLLSTPDIGRRIRSLVTAHNALGSESAFSAPSIVIAAAPPVNQVAPTVSGGLRRGDTLSSTIGSWVDPNISTVSYRRQWQRCTAIGGTCQNVAGATGPTYRLGTADVGRFMRVLVTADGLGADSTPSAVHGPIADLPGSTEDPGETGGGSEDTPGAVSRMRPFPIVVLAGRLMRGRTHISRLEVRRGPRGATVSVRCRGRGCRSRSYRTRLGRTRRVRLRRFQRTYGPGATIEIRVTQRGKIGKFTRVRIRATRPPSRRDLCLVPGRSAPARCS
jgi:hypothetical protein